MIDKPTANMLLDEQFDPLVAELEANIDKAIKDRWKGNRFQINIGEYPKQVIEEIIRKYNRGGWRVDQVRNYYNYTWVTLEFY